MIFNGPHLYKVPSPRAFIEPGNNIAPVTMLLYMQKGFCSCNKIPNQLTARYGNCPGGPDLNIGALEIWI